MDLSWMEQAGLRPTPQQLDQLLALVGDTTGTGYYVWNLAGGDFIISPSAYQRFRLPPAGSVNMTKKWRSIVHPADRQQAYEQYSAVRSGRREVFCLDYRVPGLDGEWEWVNNTARLLRDADGNEILVGSISEVNRNVRVDQLTGLLNREQLVADFSAGFGAGESGHLLMLGIDDFKTVNERYGRKTGNQVLRLFARLLEQQLAGGRAYRLDGDRFAVVLAEKNRAAVGIFYASLRKQYQIAVQGLEPGLYSALSAGAAAYPGDADTMPGLIQFAESALNTAKRGGRNSLVFFSRPAFDGYLKALGLRAALQHSVAGGFAGFELYYQPLMSAEDGKLEGAEALLRWTGPEHGRVPPDVFVPLLEESGLICEVGRWVVEHAVEQCRVWREHLADFFVSINISRIQLEKDDVAGHLLGCLRRARLPGNAVMLEMTESQQMDDYQRYNETLSYLRRIGVVVAIDDFGTGYSSLGYFKELDISYVKVDRSFVTRILESEYDYRLVQFIVELAHSIGVKVCVEGIEADEELRALLPLRPDVLQGFHFSRPVPAAEFEHFVTAGEGLPTLEQTPDELEGEDTSVLFDFVSGREWLQMMDEIDEIVVVSGVEDGEILHLNEAARQFYGVEGSYAGKTCYGLLLGRKAMCDSCHRAFLKADRFTSLEYESTLQPGEPVPVRVKLIPWKGRMARLSIVMPRRAGYGTVRKANHQLRVEKAIVTSALALAGGRDLRDAMESVLMEIGEFYKADRTYVFEFEEDGATASTTYEWCAANVAPEMDVYQNVDFRKGSPNWLRAMNEKKSVVSRGPEDLRRQFPKEHRALSRSGADTFILAPFFVEERLGGFVGVDNPRYAQGDPALLESLSYFLSNEVSKRHMAQKLHALSYVDALSGVFNRNRFLMDRQNIRAEGMVSFAVVFADINGLKEANDKEGHERGDEMIRSVAEDLDNTFTGYDVYRIGGDEFVVLCRNITEEDLVRKVMALEKLQERGDYSVSIGSAWASGNIDIDALARQADERMYKNKNEYYSGGQFYRQARTPNNTEMAERG